MSNQHIKERPATPFAEYLEIDRVEIDDYLEGVGFVERNYAKIVAA